MALSDTVKQMWEMSTAYQTIIKKLGESYKNILDESLAKGERMVFFLDTTVKWFYREMGEWAYDYARTTFYVADEQDVYDYIMELLVEKTIPTIEKYLQSQFGWRFRVSINPIVVDGRHGMTLLLNKTAIDANENKSIRKKADSEKFSVEAINLYGGDAVMGDKFDIKQGANSMIGNIKTTGSAVAFQDNSSTIHPFDFEALRADIERVKNQIGVDSSIIGKLDELLEAVNDKDEEEVKQITNGWTQKFKEKILPFLQGASALASVIGVVIK